MSMQVRFFNFSDGAPVPQKPVPRPSLHLSSEGGDGAAASAHEETPASEWCRSITDLPSQKAVAFRGSIPEMQTRSHSVTEHQQKSLETLCSDFSMLRASLRAKNHEVLSVGEPDCICLVGSPPTKVKAHLEVLLLRCAFLQRFSCAPAAPTTGGGGAALVFKFPDLDVELFQNVLDFVYCGRCHLEEGRCERARAARRARAAGPRPFC